MLGRWPIALFIVCALAACAGTGGGSVPATTGTKGGSSGTNGTPTPVPSPGNVTFSVVVPGRSGTSAIHRLRVKPFTSAQNVQAALTITPQNGSPITPAPFSCTSVCSGSVTVPAGVAEVAVTLQDATTKAPLAEGSTAVVVAPNQTSPVLLALDGVVNSVQVAIAQPTVNAGSTATTLAVVNALDADGDFITYGGNYLDANGHSVAIGLSSSDPTVTLSSTVVGAPNAVITLSYSGATSSGNVSITPSIVSGSVSGAMTPSTLAIAPSMTAVNDTMSNLGPFNASGDGAYLFIADGGSGGVYNGGSFAPIMGTSFEPFGTPFHIPKTSDGHYNAGGLAPGSGAFIVDELGSTTSMPACSGYAPIFADTAAAGFVLCNDGAALNAPNTVATFSTVLYVSVADVVEFGTTPYLLQYGKLTQVGAPAPTGTTVAYGTLSNCDSNYYIVAQTSTGSVVEAQPVGASGPTGTVTTVATLPSNLGMPPRSRDITTTSILGKCTLIEVSNSQIVRVNLSNGAYVAGSLLSVPPDPIWPNGGNVYVFGGTTGYRLSF